jgi:nicotinate-nucleotide pyrophosphorylase (carboxylating)
VATPFEEKAEIRMTIDFDLSPQDYGPLIEMAKAEDYGEGDITSRIAARPSASTTFNLVAREDLVWCGSRVAEAVLAAYDDTLTLQWADGIADGCAVRGDDGVLATIRGDSERVLAAERVLLNFVQRLCGIATETRRYVRAVAGTPARIYDTRKTVPGWRKLDKYAVRCGGGCNHRMGLYDAILIKDNHLAEIDPDRLAASLFEMLNQAATLPTAPTFVEVEVDRLDQLREVFKVVGIDVVLLDNFSPAALVEAVRLRDGEGLRGKVDLEASGGVSLETVGAIAETGVDRISVGAITHSARAVDLALEAV